MNWPIHSTVTSGGRVSNVLRNVRETTVSFVLPLTQPLPAGRGDIGQLFLERSLMGLVVSSPKAFRLAYVRTQQHLLRSETQLNTRSAVS